MVTSKNTQYKNHGYRKNDNLSTYLCRVFVALHIPLVAAMEKGADDRLRATRARILATFRFALMDPGSAFPFARTPALIGPVILVFSVINMTNPRTQMTTLQRQIADL